MVNVRAIEINTDDHKLPIVSVRDGDDLREVTDDDLETMIQSFRDPLNSDQLIELAELKSAKWVIFARDNNLLDIAKSTDGYLQSDWNYGDRIADDMYPAVLELAKIMTDAGRFEEAIQLSEMTGFVGSNADAKKYIARTLVKQGKIDKARDVLKQGTVKVGYANSLITEYSKPEIGQHSSLNMTFEKLEELIQNKDVFKENLRHHSRLYSSEQQIYSTIYWNFKFGYLSEAIEYAFQHIDPIDEAIALKWITDNLVLQNHNEYAELVAKTIISLVNESEDEEDQYYLRQEYANAMGLIGKFATAFRHYEAQFPEKFLQHLLSWRNAIDAVEPQLTLKIMQRILPILTIAQPHLGRFSAIVNGS